MEDVAFRRGRVGDADAIRALLVSAALPVDDLTDGKQEFVIAEVGGRVVGCVAIELVGEACLLRSLVVHPEHRGRGIAAGLHERAEALASLHGARVAFLLTTTAAAYAERKGFERVERAQVPASVSSLAQFREVCPKSAVCMRRVLAGEARWYPKDVLELAPDVAGASFFAVALERVMLTWFEVEPGARFERHSHDADQITLVVEGELVFELDGGRERRVGAGEVIALPAGVPHGTRAGTCRTRAVDAWSPPRR
jgi:amino-acid N-acetyltransferase